MVVGPGVIEALGDRLRLGPRNPDGREGRFGVIAGLTRRIADYGISLRGFSAAVMGTRFIAHVALDEAEDADRVMEILARA